MYFYLVSGLNSLCDTFQCPMEYFSLDPRFVFVLDANMDIYIWMGKKSPYVMRSKARYVYANA